MPARVPLHRVLERVRQGISALCQLGHEPARLAQLVGGATTVTLLNVAILWCSLQAFSAGASFVEVGLVLMIGGAIGNAAPTPGGLGAFEAATVGGFVALHVAAGPAVAGVLTFRLITFWLPIAPGAWAFTHLRRRRIL
jgi:uncharacterized protein (TIRG00374 family)